MVKEIYVNLPVKELNRTTEFFTKLGFTFNPQFTDENATCMIIGPNIYAMLLLEKFFETFTKKPISDSMKTTEVILALSLDSRQDVDDMVAKAIDAGGSAPNETQDHGWMYSHGFQDLDGHMWEVFYADESLLPPQ